MSVQELPTAVGLPTDEPVAPPSVRSRDVLLRLRRNPGALVGLAIIGLVVFLAVFAPLIAPETPSGQAYLDRLGGRCCPGPSADHWFGLDELGRDVFSRIVYGARVSLVVALASVSLALVLGGLLGAVAGYFGGAADATIMRVVDVMLAFPSFLFAIGLVALLGPGLWQLMVAIGVANVPIFARLLRGSMLGVRTSSYIASARVLGLPRRRVLGVHMLPNAVSPLIVAATLALATAIIETAGLGFLGLGNNDPAQPEWGAMLANTTRYLQTAPHLAFFPGIAIVVTVLGFNLLGDGLREAIDPRLDVMALLEVDDLAVRFKTLRGEVYAVNGVDLAVDSGETVALVGESGCGKSVTALAILGLLGRAASVTRGRVRFDGRDLTHSSEGELRRLRGASISMIFQDPMTSLNPVMAVGAQIREILEVHTQLRRADARSRSVELLEEVGIPDAARRADQYPHQFSGGMRQRAVIAIAIACNPRLLIADEPTTALDVTVQAQILSLLRHLIADHRMALLLITHDLGVVADTCTTTNVMYGGRVVEAATTRDLFRHPAHPYTVALLRSIPKLDGERKVRLAAIAGQPPVLRSAPIGCTFAARCPRALERCRVDTPALEPEVAGRVACWNPVTVA